MRRPVKNADPILLDCVSVQIHFNQFELKVTFSQYILACAVTTHPFQIS